MFRLVLATIVFSFCHLPSSAQTVALDPVVEQLEQQRIAAIQNATRTLVCVFGPGGQGGGSGVLVSPDGYAVTNFHVIQSCREYMKCSLSDGKLYDAVIVGIDPTGDVALIRLLGRDDFPHARLADSDRVQIGDPCFAVGNPFLLATDFQPSVSWGVVSGTHRYQYPSGTILEYTDCIQTDAAINPGNSGGPLFNRDSEIIGINGRGSFEKRGRVNVGVGYAISSNQVKMFLDHLKSGRIVDHATTGFTVATAADGSVRVDDILEDSLEFRQGVRYDDELIEFAGRRIRSVNQYKNVLGIFPDRWRVPAVFRQNDGTRIELIVRLRSLHGDRELEKLVTGEPRPEVPGADPEQQRDASNSQNSQLQELNSKYAQFEAKRGYANFHFNAAQTKQIWAKFESLHPALFRQAPETLWRWRATDTTGQAATFLLGDEQSGFKGQDQTMVLEADNDWSTQASEAPGIEPLMALHLLKQLVANGPQQLGETRFFGSLPFYHSPDKPPTLARVLISNWQTTETLWFFDAESGDLIGIEFYLEPGTEPMVLQFTANADNSENFPGTVTIPFVPNTAVFTIDSIEYLRSPSDQDQPDGDLPDQSTTENRVGISPGVWFAGVGFSHVILATADETIGTLNSVDNSPQEPVDLAATLQSRMVKVNGGGGYQGLEPYQSGFCISSDGLILTMWSYVLDADRTRVTLADGTKHDAELVGYDPMLEIAVLKIDADDLMHFSLPSAQQATTGDRVYALSNLFGIATGDEPVSIQAGRIAGQTQLRARRGASETNYRGEVYLLDAITNNPGAAGGAIVNGQGQLIGVIGKEVRDQSLGTWLNFALPAREVAVAVDRIQRGELMVQPMDQARLPSEPMTIELLGIVLVPDVVRRTPPFVDAVKDGTPAARAGIRSDDLIISVDNQLTPGIGELKQRLRQIGRDSTLSITLQRGEEFVTVELK